MNNDDFDSEFEETEEESKRREMNEFAEKYFSIREKMAKLDKEEKVYLAVQEKFIGRLISELCAISVDFYPEYEPRFPVIYDDLHFQSEFLFDEIVNLCDHYMEGKPGYFRNLYQVKFEITTSFDLFKNRTDIPKYWETMTVVTKRFEEEYVEDFYFECYRKHIHLLLKRLITEFVPEIFELDSQGFREVDGLLYIGMIELFDLIREANPDEK